MECMYCGQELKKGTVSFMAVQGLGQTIASFTSDDEKRKKLFKRESKEKIIFSGEETEAYYCPGCHKIISVIGLE